MPKHIESAEAALRLAVAVALRAAQDIREGARLLRRYGGANRAIQQQLDDLELDMAVEYFTARNGLWTATRAALDCDEIEMLPGFQRDLALVRRWLDERRRQGEAQADVSADRG